MSDAEEPRSTRRPDDTPSPQRRAELRRPPATYYRRVAVGTVLPGAGLLGTRWRILGWFLVVVALASGVAVAFRLLQGGLVRTALEAAVRPELLQAVAVAIGVGAVLWVGSIVLTAEHWWPAKRAGTLGPGRVRRCSRASSSPPRLRWPCATSGCSRRSSTRSSRPDGRGGEVRPTPTPPHPIRGPTCPGSTPCSSARTPARTAGARAPTRSWSSARTPRPVTPCSSASRATSSASRSPRATRSTRCTPTATTAATSAS